MKNMAFDRKNEKSFDSISNNNLSRPSKKFHSKKRHSNNPIIKDKDGGGVPIGNKFDYSSWSLSADEDYIVFCFGKDVAKGDKGVNEVHKNSRPVNCKVCHFIMKIGHPIGLCLINWIIFPVTPVDLSSWNMVRMKNKLETWTFMRKYQMLISTTMMMTWEGQNQVTLTNLKAVEVLLHSLCEWIMFSFYQQMLIC